MWYDLYVLSFHIKPKKIKIKHRCPLNTLQWVLVQIGDIAEAAQSMFKQSKIQLWRCSFSLKFGPCAVQTYEMQRICRIQ